MNISDGTRWISDFKHIIIPFLFWIKLLMSHHVRENWFFWFRALTPEPVSTDSLEAPPHFEQKKMFKAV